MAGQVDRFGRPIPPEPGYKTIINSDGEVLQMRTTLYLDSTITATDDPDSDATRLGSIAPLPGRVVSVVNDVSALRSYQVNFLRDGDILVTREYGVYGSRLGAWSYQWDESDSTSVDDGVLVIKSDFFDSGRLKAVTPSDGMMNALACGPAAADLGTRTKSFDPTGVVNITTEFERVTTILANAGYSGIRFPHGTYRLFGNEQICQRNRDIGFVIDGGGVAIFAGQNEGDHVSPTQFSIAARADGETEELAGGRFLQGGYIADTATSVARAFFGTITGYEDTFDISNIGSHGTCSALAIGDIVLVRIGADPTDMSGVAAMMYYAEIVSITPGSGTTGTVVLRQRAPEKTPNGVGINLSRTQTHHEIIKVKSNGFQDNLVIKGIVFNNVFLASLFTRNRTVDCTWRTGTFCISAWGDVAQTINFFAERVTGWDAGGGQTSYGGAIVLQATQGTRIKNLVVKSLSGVSLLGEEVSCRGTHIDYIDACWDAENDPELSIALLSQTSGATNVISVAHAVIRGGRYYATFADNIYVDYLEVYGSKLSSAIIARLDHINKIYFQGINDSVGRTYSSHRTVDILLPLSSSAGGTATAICPRSGLIRKIRFKTTSLSISSIRLWQNGFDPPAYTEAISLVHSANAWYDIANAAHIGGGTPDWGGLGNFKVEIESNSPSPPSIGNYAIIEFEVFEADIDATDTTAAVDASKDMIRCGSGAPSANADFIRQEYLDVNASPRKWYKAVDVGTGASDWVAIN